MFDGIRRLAASGSYEPGGITSDEVWRKYAGFVPREGERLPNDVYYTILRKACTSNSQIDALCSGMSTAEVGAVAEAAAEVVEAMSAAPIL